VVVVDRELSGKGSLPYSEEELAAALQALSALGDASLAGLSALDETLRADQPDLHRRLYPYNPAHLLTCGELYELFDTTPDLTGTDLDISRFIRSGDDRDLSVFWREVPEGPAPSTELQPGREELCPVPFLDAREWLCQTKAERRHEGCRAWIWDHLQDAWRYCLRSDLFPGRVVLVDVSWGGYDPRRGFTGQKGGSKAPPMVLPRPLTTAPEDRADAALNRDDLSQFEYKTILTHSAEVASALRELLSSVGLDSEFGELCDLAARLHDWGKAHPVFQSAIAGKGAHTERQDLAKAPAAAWRRGYKPPGFRHELASVLSIFELLRTADPWHNALLGPHRELFAATGVTVEENGKYDGTEFADALQTLDADSFNLLVYLICAHHGKVRGAWHAAPSDQESANVNDGTIPLRGVREGDEVPSIRLPSLNGKSSVLLPRVSLHLDLSALGLSTRYGASWGERALSLVEKHGPFTLAYLEALFRCADVRASKLSTADPILSADS
jgi:CRISPR-associated endonuclease/helicase Cas3